MAAFRSSNANDISISYQGKLLPVMNARFDINTERTGAPWGDGNMGVVTHTGQLTFAMLSTDCERLPQVGDWLVVQIGNQMVQGFMINFSMQRPVYESRILVTCNLRDLQFSEQCQSTPFIEAVKALSNGIPNSPAHAPIVRDYQKPHIKAPPPKKPKRDPFAKPTRKFNLDT